MRPLATFMVLATPLFAQHRHIGKPIQVGDQPNVLYDAGDSITRGYGASAGYPDILSLATPFTVTNAGINGQRMSEIAEHGADADATYARWARFNVESTLACTNDLLNGVSAADCFSQYKAYHLARKAAGWKVIAWTLQSINGEQFYSKDVEAKREEFNALLLADHDWVAVLIRLDLTALGCDGCWQDSTLFNADGIHPTDAGQAILASLESAAVNSILGMVQVSH